MAKSATMDFHWNYSQQGIVERKGFGRELNKFFADTLLEYAEPLTPMKTGYMRGQATTEGSNQTYGKIEYPDVPYANYQYVLETPNRTTPGTTSYWLDMAWLWNKPQITSKVGAYRRWHSK